MQYFLAKSKTHLFHVVHCQADLGGFFLSYSYTFWSSPPLSLSHHHFSISDLFYLILIHLNHHHPREFISLIIIILALLRSFWRSERFKLVLVGFSKVWSFLEQLKLSDPSPCKLLWDVCMQDWIVASMFWMVDSWFSQNNLKKIGFNISADISYISVFLFVNPRSWTFWMVGLQVMAIGVQCNDWTFDSRLLTLDLRL